MHPTLSIIRAGELRRQDLVAEAARLRWCEQAASRRPRALPGPMIWALSLALVLTFAMWVVG